MEFRALLIATSAYRSLPDIPSAVNDVDALADALAGPEADGSGVETLLNPSRMEVLRALSEALDSASRDTTLLIHFACHGIVDSRGKSFLALTDTDPESPASTALDTDFIMDLIEGGRAGSVIVLLDACMAGGWNPTSWSFGPSQYPTTPRQSTAFIRCTYGRSLAGEPHSRFTQALINALGSDDTDPDGDGIVTAEELHAQVARSLRGAGDDRQLSYGGTGAAAMLPMASMSRFGLAERVLEHTVLRTRLGRGAYRLSWGSALDGFVALEVHPGQYSVNWHSTETAADFVALCRRALDCQVLLERASGAQIDLSGLDVWWLAIRSDLDADLQLVRYWLRDSSVAWQRLHPAGPPIVGVASDTVDAVAVTRLVRRTATAAVLGREDELMRVLGSLDSLRRAPLSELRDVLGEE